jgi:hypothetical protein
MTPTEIRTLARVLGASGSPGARSACAALCHCSPRGRRYPSQTSNTDNGTTDPFTHRKAFTWHHRQRMLTGWH